MGVRDWTDGVPDRDGGDRIETPGWRRARRAVEHYERTRGVPYPGGVRKALEVLRDNGVLGGSK